MTAAVPARPGPQIGAAQADADGRRFAIRTEGLSKVFGQQKAVDGVDLAVPRGAVFGFLGPNGSGKTTTIRMLLGLSAASGGSIYLLDGEMPKDARAVLPRVGALVEGPAIYPFLSGRANLQRFDAADRHTSPATRNARVDAALERVGLGHAARKKAHAYSLGMKQRLGIANALLAPRDLLILDEPTNGLDPQGTREVRNLIKSLSDDGTTIFVSSHLLAEVEQMCSMIAVMSAGRLVAQGTLDELRAVGTARVRIETPDVADARRVLTGLGLTPQPHGRDDVITAELTVEGLLPETVNAALVRADVRVRGFEASGASLEDRFVALTGEGFDVAG